MIGQTLFALFALFSHFFARSDNRLLYPATASTNTRRAKHWFDTTTLLA